VLVNVRCFSLAMVTVAYRRCSIARGEWVEVGSPTPSDMSAFEAYWWALFREARGLVTTPGEAHADGSPESWLTAVSANPFQLALVVRFGSEICGHLIFRAGPRQRIAHRGSFDMAVRPDWRRRGVGDV